MEVVTEEVVTQEVVTREVVTQEAVTEEAVTGAVAMEVAPAMGLAMEPVTEPVMQRLTIAWMLILTLDN
jgi:hypothetical protein